ncbi:hypothetical protein J4206_00580 [Candidatus Woesearchaeota archaeon]|nr:hypothetical protein [Candidatus Woesearchaeota archaeon]
MGITKNIFENITKLITKQEDKQIIDIAEKKDARIKFNKGSSINSADKIYNFCKIRGNAFIQKQIEHRNGRVYMRSKKRNLILIKHRGEGRVEVNNINHGKFDGMYHI